MRALLVWELGDNLGHAGMLFRIGEELAARGTEVFIALQDTLKAAPFLGNPRITLLAAPYGRIHPQPRPPGPPRPVLSYADDVALCGYAKPAELAAMIQAWHGLFDLVQPDILIADAAPTALLAAQGRSFKKILSGMGYGVPPYATPMPPFRYWDKPNSAALLKNELATLAVINQAQALIGKPPFKAFQDIIRSDAQFITTFAELDHYPNRTDGIYTGPFFSADRGEDILWQERPAKRIFAYLYPGRKSFAPTLAALKLLKEDVILVAPGLPEAIIKQNTSPYFRLFATPLRTDRLCDQADLFISHGGGTTVTQFLLAGVPQFALPNHIEQTIMTRRMTEQNFALSGDAGMKPEELQALILKAASDPLYRTAAQTFAAKYKDFKAADQVVAYVDRMMALVEKTPG